MSTTRQDATHSLFSERCFIIQPFEHNFIERCDEYFKPAIEEAGLSPYRVDEHYEPDQLLRINVIYKEIQNALVCLADISMDKPNVWYEFGFADGKEIPVVLICDKKSRENLPFDANQRDVYFYHSDSSQGLLDLRAEISKRIHMTAAKAIEKRKRVAPEMASHIKDFRTERLEMIRERELPVKLPSSLPTVAFHIIPVHGFSGEEQIDFDTANLNELEEPISGRRRNNVDGICWYNQRANEEYAQLFQQTGIMEYVWTFCVPDHFPEHYKRILPSLLIMQRLIWVLYSYTENLKKFNFNVPPWDLFLGISLLNVKDYLWASKEDSPFDYSMPADRPDLILPLDSQRTSGEDGGTATLYPLFNRLWQAFGYESCPYEVGELRAHWGMMP